MKDIRNTITQGAIALAPQTDNSRMEGLAAKPPGPRGPHKLNVQVMAYVERTLTENNSIRPLDIAVLIKEAFGVSVHPRSRMRIQTLEQGRFSLWLTKPVLRLRCSEAC